MQPAIEFAKKHQAVTYLVLSLEDAELLGYFSITIKPLVVKAEPFSKTARRKLARFSEIDKGEQTYNLAAYLIAQLGKNFNDKARGRITRQELLETAIRQTQILQYQAGGMVVFVEPVGYECLCASGTRLARIETECRPLKQEAHWLQTMDSLQILNFLQKSTCICLEKCYNRIMSGG